jgi:class 3 adenylate cyclase
VGRKKELAVLSEAIEAAQLPFMVAFVHGPGGIGKSHLIKTALSDVGTEVQSYFMDCREIEPTPQGFQAALGTALGMGESEPDFRAVVSRLGEMGERTVMALYRYETFGLMDTWLRQEFMPALSENVFTIIAGRQAPNSAWFTTPGWQGLFREIELRELSADDAQIMLESRGLTSTEVERVKGFARGHPLALEMAAAAIRTQPDLEITEGPPPKVLQQLTQAFLAGLPEKTTEVVEAASVVRRVTEPLLKALLPDSNARELFHNLQALPFIDVTSEGLIFHDVVREVISKDLALRSPERYRSSRSHAWRFLSKESHQAVARGLWQYTADLLYLIENPVVRDAFFPEGGTELRVEPASASDAGDVRAILENSEPEESAQLIERWLDRHPETFFVAKTRDGKPEAFYIAFEPSTVDHNILEEDPLTSAWIRHLDKNPVAEGERVLFIRRWLDRATGEDPSPAVGACFLDMKRAYMELRPSLRRVYGTVMHLPTFEPILFPLGFAPLEAANVVLGGVTYYTIMNDLGPSSVDGWLARLIGAELGVEPEEAKREKGPDERRAKEGRLLATVLFTDIVSSTEHIVKLGDARWRDLLESHYALVRKELVRFEGHEIDTAGDGFFATFERPAQAIQCACAISDSVRQLGIEIRAGLHLGECEATGEAIRGIAVHVGARVAAKAEVGEVWVSKTLKDAVAGSEIRFKDRGTHILKGIPGEWHLFAVERGSVA